MLIDKLKNDLILSRKQKDKFRLGVISTFTGEAELIGKQGGNRLPTDREINELAKKFIKNIHTNLELSDRNTMALIKEKEILKEYLSAVMSDEKLKFIIAGYINDSDHELSIGDIMRYLKSYYKNQYDGKTASNIARELLK